MNKSESIASLAAALSKAQAAIEGASKDKTNPHFRSKYADLASVTDAIKPHLAAHGLAYVQVSHDTPNGVGIETVILHSSGEWLSCGVLQVPVSQQDAQGYGSALTYARRYSLSAAFGVAPEDDDGNAAAKAAPRREEAKPTQDDINCQAFISSIGASADLDECRQITTEGVAWAKGLGRHDFVSIIKQAGITKSESLKVAA